MSACGGSQHAGASAEATAGGARTHVPPRGPAFGLTEDNADLLWSPTHPAPSGGVQFQPARLALSALHPRYVRLLVDWAVLQPDPDRPAALDAPVSGCARAVGPCGAYAGIREQLAAIASQQRAAQATGQADFQVVIDVFGTPGWAAREPGGCELDGTRAFSRPLSDAGIAGYRALIRSLLALGAQEHVSLEWWSPWNEPNEPAFLSPQRPSCTAASPPSSPSVYAELAEAMAAELRADGGVHHLLLGELSAVQSDSPHRTSIASFIASLPPAVICLGEHWSIHAYAARGSAAPSSDPVAALEAALDARGACGRGAHIWITEAGAGAPHPGRSRHAGAAHVSAAEELDGCQALAAQLLSWYGDPRIEAVLQYTFREDPAFPVGLLSADLSHQYPTYRLWRSYARVRARGSPLPSPASLCT